MRNPERSNNRIKNIMTVHTKAALEEALRRARAELRQAQFAIGEAAGGESNWHDNAAFDYANLEYDLKSAYLGNLTRKLQDVEIITPRIQTDEVGIGNTVVVRFGDELENERFTILGPDDSGRRLGWLSYLSPLGRSIIGRKEGETVEFLIEGERKQRVEVIKILPGDFE